LVCTFDGTLMPSLIWPDDFDDVVAEQLRKTGVHPKSFMCRPSAMTKLSIGNACFSCHSRQSPGKRGEKRRRMAKGCDLAEQAHDLAGAFVRYETLADIASTEHEIGAGWPAMRGDALSTSFAVSADRDRAIPHWCRPARSPDPASCRARDLAAAFIVLRRARKLAAANDPAANTWHRGYWPVRARATRYEAGWQIAVLDMKPDLVYLAGTAPMPVWRDLDPAETAKLWRRGLSPASRPAAPDLVLVDPQYSPGSNERRRSASSDREPARQGRKDSPCRFFPRFQ